jgi:hypothetical protein
MDIQVSFVY